MVNFSEFSKKFTQLLFATKPKKSKIPIFNKTEKRSKKPEPKPRKTLNRSFTAETFNVKERGILEVYQVYAENRGPFYISRYFFYFLIAINQFEDSSITYNMQ